MERVGYRVTTSNGQMYWTMRDFMPPDETGAEVERCIVKKLSEVRVGEVGYFHVLGRDKYAVLEAPRTLYTVFSGKPSEDGLVLDVYYVNEDVVVHSVRRTRVRVAPSDVFIIPQEQ